MPSSRFLHSADETIAAGHELAQTLSSGAVVALVGELGAGKTHFSKGFARGLGVDPDSVSSPTFTLLNEYSGNDLELYHFDFYRLEDVSELDGLGWDEIIEAGGIVLAEWASMFPDVFPPETVWVELSHTDDGRKLSYRV